MKTRQLKTLKGDVYRVFEVGNNNGFQGFYGKCNLRSMLKFSGIARTWKDAINIVNHFDNPKRNDRDLVFYDVSIPVINKKGKVVMQNLQHINITKVI